MSMPSWRPSIGITQRSCTTGSAARGDPAAGKGEAVNHVFDANASLEIKLVAYGVDARLGAGLVRIAAGSPGHADGAQQRACRLDRQSAADDDGAGQVADSGLHHPGLADGIELGRAGAKAGRG